MSNNSMLLKQFENHLRLERALAENSILAYRQDLQKLNSFLKNNSSNSSFKNLPIETIEYFLKFLHDIGLAERSQSRILSALKTFYRFLNDEEITDHNPVELLTSPALGRKLPTVLSFEEIEQLTNSVDLSTPEGTRNRAILEVLYGSGLRVSELTNLKLSNCYPELQLLKIMGKGNKERLVPLHQEAWHYLELYTENIRRFQKIQKNNEDFVFLNRRGKVLSRVMIFMIVKNIAKTAGLEKNISPHTFRHSFATHLVEGGADLRAVQELLGHESILTTEIYTHLDIQFLQDTIQSYHPRNTKN